MPRRLRVATLGSAIQDVFHVSNAFETRKDPDAPDGMDACMPLGAKIALDDLVLATGGGATNAAVTFARFGYEAICIARVGADLFGDGIVDTLQKEGITTTFVQRDPKQKTGYSSIIVAGGGHRAILTLRGASAHLDKKALAKTPKVDGWYITSLGGDLATLRVACARAATQRARIAWNPGNAELALGLTALRPILKKVDYLILNREEAAVLTHQPPRALGKILDVLAAIVPGTIAVTDGRHGAYLAASGELLFAPPLPAKRKNTTGAGDAFGSASAAILFAGGSPALALAVGMLNATGVIQQMGAKAGILKELPTATAIKRVKMFSSKES